MNDRIKFDLVDFIAAMDGLTTDIRKESVEPGKTECPNVKNETSSKMDDIPYIPPHVSKPHVNLPAVVSHVGTKVPSMTGIFSVLNMIYGPNGEFPHSLEGIFDQLMETPRPEPKKSKRVYDGVKFSYYGETGMAKNHGGIITIACIFDKSNKIVHYGIAFCSPNDVYNKEKGKEIAFKDLNNRLALVSVSKNRHHNVLAKVLADVYAVSYAPSWAKGMITNSLIYHLEMSS